MEFVQNLLVSIVCLCLIIHWATASKRDSSDKDEKNRSGLMIRTDHLTGVQYVETPFGGITPRLNPDGSLVVTKTTSEQN